MFQVAKFGDLVIGALLGAIRIGGAASCSTVSSIGDPRKGYRVDARLRRLRLKARDAREASISLGREARWFVAGLLLAELVAGTPALAQSSGATPTKTQAMPVPGGNAAPADRDKEARKLYAQGIQARNAKQWEKAREAFHEALKLKQHPQIIANLGHAELMGSRYRDAAEHLSSALRQGQIFTEQDRREIEKMLEAAKAQIGTVTIQVNVDGARVVVDALDVGISPLAAPVPIEPGSRTFKVMKNGFMGASQVVEVAAGSAPVVELKLTPSPVLSAGPAVGATAAPTGDRPPARSVVPGVVLGGVAGAALLTGVALLFEGGLKRDDAHAVSDAIRSAQHSCVTGAGNFDPRCPQLNDTALSAGTFHNVGVGFVVGASAAAVGSAAYFLWPMLTSRRPSTLRLSPAMFATDAGLLFSGTF